VDTKRSGPDNAGLVNLLRQAENPFDSYKVLTARDSVVDVPEIHQREFEKLNAELDKVRKSGKSRGVLVTGIAGSGKSHLIARLYNERPKEALFFQVQALPGGTAWFRQILQCIVSDLAQPISREEAAPQLVMLIRHFIDGVRHELGRSNRSSYSFDTLNMALDARQRQIQKTIPSPLVQDVLAVLVNLWKWQAPSTRAKRASQTTRKTDLAVQWLKAVMIDEDDLAEIGACQNLGASEEAGQLDYLNVLRVFGYLTLGQAPIILYFDQLDTMEAETINSLGDQLLHLIGSDAAAPNYLVVTAGVREEVSKFLTEKVIKQAVADVIFGTELDLPALTMNHCLRIVEKRLQQFIPNSERKDLPDSADALFPFTKNFLEGRLKGPIKPSPRGVLKIVKPAFDDIIAEANPEWLKVWPHVLGLTDLGSFDGPPSIQSVNEFLREEFLRKFDARLHQKSTGPMDGDLLAETVHRLLKICDQRSELKIVDLPKGLYKKPTNSFFALTVGASGVGIVGIVVNNRNHAGSMKACLSRCLEFLSRFDDKHKIIMGRDEQSKAIENWPSCMKLVGDLAATNRFLRTKFEASEIATLLALDELRKEVPDLVVPPSKLHGVYQVTQEDFLHFLVESDLLQTLPFLVNVRDLLTKEESPHPPPNVVNFVRARVEAKCIIALKELVTEWANHKGRVDPVASDHETIDEAARSLCSEGLIVSLGHGAKRILKKL
jgi:hypothetical protein